MLFRAIVCASVVAATSASALANDLPDASPLLFFKAGSVETFHTALGTIAGPGGSASALFAPNAVITVATTPGNRYDASLNYSFRLNGPADTIVPLIAYARISVAKDAGFGRVVAGLNIHNGFSYVASKSFELGNADGAATAGFTGGMTFAGHTGATGEFNLFAMANSWSMIASAFVDPYLTVDPAYALIDPNYATKYSFSFSQGAGNVAPGGIPEPESWALMIAGFGLVGAIARRKQSQAA